MSAQDTIREMLDRDPFEPFRLVTSSGESYKVTDPHSVALMRSEVLIAQPNSDRRTFVQYLHVAAVETLANGGRRTARRKRRQ
jgi:hypothetical protein